MYRPPLVAEAVGLAHGTEKEHNLSLFPRSVRRNSRIRRSPAGVEGIAGETQAERRLDK
ncbi:MAG: hypothetical protein OJF50_002117 [Nitrospira sp.]|nr:hypothetical protein [Nitrospira sp.]